MININYGHSKPIYEQVKDGLRKLIVTGAMAPDEKLPSVRTLATQLAINPNTIQRAYRELENEGYLVTLPGKGTFAAEDAGAGDRRIALLWQQLERTADELRFAGISTDQLIAHLQKGANHD